MVFTGLLRSPRGRLLLQRLVVVGAALAAPRIALADSLTATVISPANGAVNVDLGQYIRWSGIATAQSYYLYVGSTPGAKDLINTGEIQTTQYPARTLPPGRVVYVRLWTKVAGAWRYADSSFSGVAPAAVMVYPTAGQTTADLNKPLQWTSVPTAEAYYLYVGSAPGAKDLVNSGETQLTTWPAFTIPSNQLVYVRLWTRVAGAWRYVDSSFSGALSAAMLTAPADNATNVDLTSPFHWTAVPNAQAYYLYVGTTAGAKDLVNTGEIQQTSFTAASIPTGVRVYARLWTKIAGAWRSTDSSFIGAVVGARLSYPADGATDVDPAKPAQWSDVANAQSYYLYVGTSAGARDVVDSGEITTTSFAFTRVPTNQTLYARLWTKIANVWRYRDSTFGVPTLAASMTYPADGAVNVNADHAATWSIVADAQKYYLYIGTAKGAADVVDSGETTATTWPIATVPPNRVLFVRLWTKLWNTWRYMDSTFVAGSNAPAFIYPRNGAVSVDPSRPIAWTPALGGDTHWLVVGTSPGADDIANTGEITATSQALTGVRNRTMYARVWSKVNGRWSRHTDIAFTTRARTRPGAMLAPVNGDLAFDAGQPFQWSPARLGQAYRLIIGSAPGANDLHDSGEIWVTRRFVPGLPLGAPLYGQLQTKIDGEWFVTDFTFAVAAETWSPAARIAQALWATDVVRNMAPADNRPFSWTPLLGLIAPRYNALCSDYAVMLLTVLDQMNLGLPTRRLDVSFQSRTLDAHTLAEVYDPDSQRWLLLDPTFDLTAKLPDGTWATAEDVSAATRSGNTSSITYVFLGAAGDAYARAYYIDFPLLFLNIYHPGQWSNPGPGFPVHDFLLEEALPVSGAWRVHVIQCLDAPSVSVLVDGVPTTIACTGTENTSLSFFAFTVASPTEVAPFRTYQLPRLVF